MNQHASTPAAPPLAALPPAVPPPAALPPAAGLRFHHVAVIGKYNAWVRAASSTPWRIFCSNRAAP